MNRLVLACVLLVPSLALGQTVFFDDFNGNALLPHWNQPPANAWAYNVSGGMLNVTGLFSPSNPKVMANMAGISAFLSPVSGDFAVHARMGWDAGAGQGVEIAAGNIAQFGFRAWGGFSSVIFAGAGGQVFQAPAPPPGLHDFDIVRTGNILTFGLDGSVLAQVTLPAVLPLTEIGLWFRGPFPGSQPSLHVDRVEVVPAPSIMLIGATMVCGCSFKRRRSRCQDHGNNGSGSEFLKPRLSWRST